MASNPSAKRKQPPGPHNTFIDSKRAAKRVKTSDARRIQAQASDKALSQNGELDVSAFVKAREYEIKAMESSMGSSRMFLSSRAFQQVPKDMRRRTASHNVKKVPKRLRARAVKEMRDDNTPTVTSRRRNPTPHMRLRLETAKKLEILSRRIQTKRDKAFNLKHRLNGPNPAEKESSVPKPPKSKKNTLATPQRLMSKYRRRQVHKSWLPTHIWHAKRAHMPEPKLPLWRFAIPLRPTGKVHRPTHRAGSSRGCVAWDTSYMSTVSVRGVEASLLGLLGTIGVEEAYLTMKKGAKWRRGTRLWDGWIRERDGDRSWMAKVQIVWCVVNPKMSEGNLGGKTKAKRQVLIRVHPSAFLEVWTEVLKVAKIQKPSPDVEDLRFEIGSIEITGPGSTECLVGILHPKLEANIDASDDIPEKIWPQLGTVSNPSALPASTVLTFNIHDPRLFHPPQKVQALNHAGNEHEMLTTLATWPPDATVSSSPIFSQIARYTASRLPSQKAINRRKGEALPGNYPDPLPTDPTIPVLLFTSRAPTLNMQATWTLLLPWKCVLPVWYSLMHYPLSTGGAPRFGGLQEKRQVLFEQGQAWFPGDFPGTRAGWQWEMMERDKRKKSWEKRPKSKRVSWNAVDLGDGKKGEIGIGWACDWERLFEGPPPPSKQPSTPETSTEAINARLEKLPKDASLPAPASRPPLPPTQIEAAKPPSCTPSTLPPKPPLSITHLPFVQLSTFPSIPLSTITPIHLRLLHRGAPATCARIYRIPTTNPALRKKWISLLSSINSKVKPATCSDKSALPPRVAELPSDAPAHIKRQALARALLQGPATPAEEDYPACPAEEDLIGFVTTGNFDLGEGRGAAVGNVAVARVFWAADASESVENNKDKKCEVKSRTLKAEDKIAIVRNAGQSVGRLARWDFI